MKKVKSENITTFKKQKTLNLNEAVSCYKKGLKALNFNAAIPSETIPDASASLSLMQSLDFLKLIADTYVKIAEVNEDNKNKIYTETLHKALDYYNVTAGIIQNARKEISSEESKIKLVELEQATFQKMIHTAYKTYEIDGNQDIMEFAFKNAERIKASSVFDKLSDELAKNNSLIPDSLIELEKTLNYSITKNNELLYTLSHTENPDSLEIASTDSVLFQLKKQREELNQHLEQNYSNFYNLKYADLLFGISDIQQKLKTNEVVLEYVLNENDSLPELYTFFISPGSARFIKVETEPEFITSIEKSFRFMSNPRYMFTRNEDSKEFCTASNYLYRKLILPFEKEIKDKKLLVIPDGKLSYIAFDALLEELPDTAKTINFTQLKYLIRKNNINYSYSANLLFKFNKPKHKSRNQVLAFAPEYSRDTFTFDNQKLTLAPLPGIQKEVDLIAKAIKTKLFKGADASELNFRKNSENYNVLHLAMHAFIDDSQPAYSRLAFFQNDNENAENNGWLNTADIYNLNLNARMTVLSACNTGSGTLRKGEGVMSLARGFLYAGCPTIVMTLWEVEDNAGTKIMASFYKNLKKGRAVDEALRLAKLEYLENANPRTAHPHYWLGYVSIGDDTPLFRSYDFYFFGLLIIALAGVITDQIVRALKSRKKRTEKK